MMHTRERCRVRSSVEAQYGLRVRPAPPYPLPAGRPASTYSRSSSLLPCLFVLALAKPATCTCLEATYATSSTVSLGHSEGAVSLVDFTREGEMVACCWPEKSFVPTGAALSGVHSVAPYRRGVICALNSPKGGSMVVTDFRDRRLCASQPSLSCFSGAIGCVKTQSLNSDLVVCCGYSKSRYGSEGGLVRDPYIKVFDVRYAVRAVTQVLCGFAPVAVTCHPQFSDCFLSFSEAGIVSVTDVSAGHGQVMQQFQLQASPYAQEGVHFAAGDISTSGDVFVFGDTVGNVQLWGTDATSALNPISEPLPVPSDTSYETCSTYQMDENGPLACVPTYAREDEGEPLLSDISKQDMCVGFPPRDLYPQVAREMATVDAKLSVVRITTKNEGILKNLNYRIPNPISRGVRRRDRKANDVFVPGKYLYKQIQGGGFHEGKYVEFDFGFYNTTKFAGLENNLPNCYCNPLLQVLYFTYPFCSELLRCTPDPNAEFCIRDELSFLVYMLRRAEGDQPCQAQNLMRALMQVRFEEWGGQESRGPPSPASLGPRRAALTLPSSPSPPPSLSVFTPNPSPGPQCSHKTRSTSECCRPPWTRRSAGPRERLRPT